MPLTNPTTYNNIKTLGTFGWYQVSQSKRVNIFHCQGQRAKCVFYYVQYNRTPKSSFAIRLQGVKTKLNPCLVPPSNAKHPLTYYTNPQLQSQQGIRHDNLILGKKQKTKLQLDFLPTKQIYHSMLPFHWWVGLQCPLASDWLMLHHTLQNKSLPQHNIPLCLMATAAITIVHTCLLCTLLLFDTS